MQAPLSRRKFLQVSTACAVASAMNPHSSAESLPDPGNLVLNDDGYVFLNLSDDLSKADLRRYLKSYCRNGVGTVAYCVGDMSWPTLYPSKVGTQYSTQGAGDDLKRLRIYQNVDHFASESGGYFGAAFEILHELGKKVLASFRMNDAHFTTADNPNVSAFWKQHMDLALGSAYGYYSGCLNYASEVVREHFIARVLEFVEMHPDIDGLELDAMRSPFFFPPSSGRDNAPLFTDLARRIKTALSAQAQRLNRSNYLLSINVPNTPELALECGLDVVAWDGERLFDFVSAGTYEAYMAAPIDAWKQTLVHGTPVFAYIGCSPQTGQYLGLEEYRAAAANAHARGADGIYLFNFPCLFELSMQLPSSIDEVAIGLTDMRSYGQLDETTAPQVLEEVGDVESLRQKNKRFLFYFNESSSYRHNAPVLPLLDRGAGQGSLTAAFPCYEDYEHARSIVLRFKIVNVSRTERFQASLNGNVLELGSQHTLYAANGRDTRIHTVTLGPYHQCAIPVEPSQLRKGENILEVTPTRLNPELKTAIALSEIELIVEYGTA